MANLRFVLIEVANVTPDLVEKVMQQAMGVVGPAAIVLQSSADPSSQNNRVIHGEAAASPQHRDDLKAGILTDASISPAKSPEAAPAQEPGSRASAEGIRAKSPVMWHKIAELIEARGPLTKTRLAQLMAVGENATAICLGKSKNRFHFDQETDRWSLKK